MPIIFITLIVVAIVVGVVLYNTTKDIKRVAYAYQSLFALVALVISAKTFNSLSLIVIDLLALSLLINGIVSLYKFKENK
jgi:hypothetical protein